MRAMHLAMRALTKVYPNGARAVDELQLDVAEGEFLVLLGPSGCGKSTVLRLIAGLESVSSGALFIAGRIANHLPPQDRDIAMVFQDFALYPAMSVRDNIAFPLRTQRAPEAEVRQRVRQLADMLLLDEYLSLRPDALSGGERQRVAMGRALARRPAVFLMDEPLSNLDTKLRASLRAEVLDLTRRAGVTTVYVTHDQAEAMTMGDRVAVMRDGALQQLGTPQEVYERPANVFVATFIGSPRMNLVGGSLRLSADDTVELDLGAQQLRLRKVQRYPPATLRELLGQPVICGIRPERLMLAAAPVDSMLRGRVRHVEFLGHEVLVHVDAGLHAPPIGYLETAHTSRRPRRRWSRRKPRTWWGRIAAALGGSGVPDASDSGPAGEQASRADPHTEQVTLVARLSPRQRPAVGDTVTLAVDTRRMHLFDFAGRLLPPVLLPEEDPPPSPPGDAAP